MSQADFYQLFTYGQKYLDGWGLALTYPRTVQLTQPLAPFYFSPEQRLDAAVPYGAPKHEARFVERL